MLICHHLSHTRSACLVGRTPSACFGVALWPASGCPAALRCFGSSSTQLVLRWVCIAVASLYSACLGLGLLCCRQCYAWVVWLVCRRLRLLMVSLSSCWVWLAVVCRLEYVSVALVASGWNRRAGLRSACCAPPNGPLACHAVVGPARIVGRAVLVLAPPPWSDVPCWCCAHCLRWACCVGAGAAAIVRRAVLVRGPPPRSGVCARAWFASMFWRALLVRDPPS